MANYVIIPLSALLFFFLEGVCGGEYCTTRGFSGFQYSATYCPYGCCGYYPAEYCCSASVGLVVGCVVAGIALICVTIAVICCCIKRPGQAGRFVGTCPQGQSNVMVVYAGQQSGQQYPAGYGMGYPGQPGQPMQPPPYKAYEPTPPAYNDPAYPPVTAPPPAGFAPPPGPAIYGGGAGPSSQAMPNVH